MTGHRVPPCLVSDRPRDRAFSRLFPVRRNRDDDGTADDDEDARASRARGVVARAARFLFFVDVPFRSFVRPSVRERARANAREGTHAHPAKKRTRARLGSMMTTRARAPRDDGGDDDVRAMGNSAVVPSFGSSETTVAVTATRDDDGRFPQPRHPDHHHYNHHRRERSASASASPRASLLGVALRQSAREDEVMKSKTSRPFGSHGSHESERVAFAFAGAFEDEVGEDAENARADAVVAFEDDAREDDEDGSRGNCHQYSSKPIDIPRSESGKGHWKTCVTLREATLHEARARDDDDRSRRVWGERRDRRCGVT